MDKEAGSKDARLGLVQTQRVPSATHCWAVGVGLSDPGNIWEKSFWGSALALTNTAFLTKLRWNSPDQLVRTLGGLSFHSTLPVRSLNNSWEQWAGLNLDAGNFLYLFQISRQAPSHLPALISTLLSLAFERHKLSEVGTRVYYVEPGATKFWFHLESVDAVNRSTCI